MSDGNKDKADPVTPENLAASQAAEEEKAKWKEEHPLKDRMAELADKASAGSSTGKGLAGLGAQIAQAVNKAKEGGDDKINVQKVAKEL